MKKLFLALIFMVGSVSVYPDQVSTIIFEEEIKEGTMPACVEVLLVELVEQTCEHEEDAYFVAFDQAIKFFIKQGCDINKPFSAVIFKQYFPAEFALDKSFIQDFEGKTLLAISYENHGTNGILTKVLLANGAV